MGTRFSLVELMIAVAIVATLAAIAIPSFRERQLEARVAEGVLVAAGIAQSGVAWALDTDESWSGACGNLDNEAYLPDWKPGRKARPWVAESWAKVIDYAPDGEVRGSYQLCMVQPTYGGMYSLHAGVDAWLDVDGDGVHRRLKNPEYNHQFLFKCQLPDSSEVDGACF